MMKAIVCTYVGAECLYHTQLLLRQQQLAATTAAVAAAIAAASVMIAPRVSVSCSSHLQVHKLFE
jgi:hypothetical protein